MFKFKENDLTYKVFNYHNKKIKAVRDDETGIYSSYEQLTNDFEETTLRSLNGHNGEFLSPSLTFMLTFPNITSSQHINYKVIKNNIGSLFYSIDSSCKLTSMEIDKNNVTSFFFVVSWSNDAEYTTKANDMMNNYIKNSASLTTLFSSLTPPWNTVNLNSSIDVLLVKMLVDSTITNIQALYDDVNNESNITLNTLGYFNNFGIKKSTDENVTRITSNFSNSINIANINPAADIIIYTLYGNNYEILDVIYSYPTDYLNNLFGSNGDTNFDSIEGSVTLDIDLANFSTYESEFIVALENYSGGQVEIISLVEGSAIVEYRILKDKNTTQGELDELVTNLSTDTILQNIVDTTTNLKGIKTIKNPNVTPKIKRDVQSKKTNIPKINYDKENDKIKFKVIGKYDKILYRTQGQTVFNEASEYLEVTSPPSFTNTIEYKLVDKHGNDMTSLKTFLFDIINPIVSINGSDISYTLLDTPYDDPGVQVSDNLDSNITPIVTGTVDHATIGTYLITYNATDSSNNTAQKTRTVKVLESINEQIFTGGNKILRNLIDINNFINLSENVTVEGIVSDETMAKFVSNPVDGKYTFKTWLGNSPFLNNKDLTGLNLPLCTNSGHDTFRGCTNLATIDMPICIAVINDCFKDCTGVSIVNMPLVETIGNDCFANCQLVNIDMPKLKSFGGSSFSNNTLCTSINWSGLDYINDWPNGIKNSTGDTGLFTNYPDNGSIYISIYYKNSNNGEIDGDLQVLAGKNWTISYVDTIQPIITLNSLSTIEINGDSLYTEYGGTAVDSLNNSVPVIIDSSSVDTTAYGETFQVTYTATNVDGVVKQIVRNVVIKLPKIIDVQLITSNIHKTGPGTVNASLTPEKLENTSTYTSWGMSGESLFWSNYKNNSSWKIIYDIEINSSYGRFVFSLSPNISNWPSYHGQDTGAPQLRFDSGSNMSIDGSNNSGWNYTSNPVPSSIFNTRLYLVLERKSNGQFNITFYNKDTLVIMYNLNKDGYNLSNDTVPFAFTTNSDGTVIYKVYDVVVSTDSTLTISDYFISKNTYNIPMEISNIIKSDSGAVNEKITPPRLENTDAYTTWGITGTAYDWTSLNTNPSWKIVYDIEITTNDYFQIGLSPGTSSWYNPPYHGQDSGNPTITFRQGQNVNINGNNNSGWSVNTNPIPEGILNTRFILVLEKDSTGKITIGFYNRNTKELIFEFYNPSYIFSNNDVPLSFTTGSDGPVIFRTFGVIGVKAPSITLTQLQHILPDMVDPVVTLVGSAKINIVEGTSYTEQGAVAIDNREGDISISIVITGSVNINTPGSYTITYSATDTYGNTGSVTRSVNVLALLFEGLVPSDKIVFNNTNGNVINDTYSVSIPSGSLNQAKSFAPDWSWLETQGFIHTNPWVLMFELKKTGGGNDYLYEINAGHSAITGGQSGNGAASVRWWKDNAPNFIPVPSGIVKITYNGSGGFTYYLYNYSGVQVHGGGAGFLLPATYKPPYPWYFYIDKRVDVTVNNFVWGTDTSLTYTDYFARFITDSVPPVITLNGPSSIVVIEGNTYDELGATVTDNSGKLLTAVITGNVDVNTSDTYVLTYTATDDSGNESQLTRTVIVKGPHVELVLSNFNKVYGGPGGVYFYPDKLKYNHGNYQAVGLKKTATVIDYSQPFRIIYKLHWTTISSDKYVELGFATTKVGQSYSDNNHYIIFEQQNIRYNGGISVISHTPINGGVNSNFYNLNVDRYISITYTGTNNQVHFYNQDGTLLFETIFNFDNHNWNNGANALYMYLNKNGGVVYGIYGTNDIGLSYTDKFIPDNTAPVITLNGPSSITAIEGDVYNELGATVTDNSGKLLTAVITGNVDVNTSGTYVLTYTATDDSGNESLQLTRTVVVKSPYVELVLSNFNKVYGGPGGVYFYPDKLKYNHGNYQAVGLKKTATVIDYSQPFRIIYKLHWTTISSDKYVELGFATTKVGQSYSDNNHYIIFEQQNIRYNGGISVISHTPINGGVNSNFYNLNVDRYISITYTGTNNQVHFYNQDGTLLFETIFNFDNHNWNNGANALYMYLNKNGGVVYGIYNTNNIGTTVSDVFGPL